MGGVLVIGLLLYLQTFHLLPCFSFKQHNLPVSSLRYSYIQLKDGSSADPPSSSASKVVIILKEEELDEKFIKGTGNGGQKINTTANRVVLTHLPTGIKVGCQDARDLSTNRKWAREMLITKLDFHFNGAESKLGQKMEKEKKRKKDSVRKKKRKYSTDDAGEVGGVEEDGERSDKDMNEDEILSILRSRGLSK